MISDYDLLLGKLPKPAGITPPTDVQDVRYGLTKLQTMHIIPGSVPKSTGGYDTGAGGVFSSYALGPDLRAEPSTLGGAAAMTFKAGVNHAMMNPLTTRPICASTSETMPQ